MLKTMLKTFARDRHATIALITAIFIFPLMFLGVGVPIDLARSIQYRAALQNLADTAALAGSEVLGIGATPAQACALTLAYANLPIQNGELPASVTPSATLSSPNGTATNCGGASVKPVTSQAAAPNVVGVTISGSQPTTFLSIYKPSIPVTVSTTAIGPQGFITINIVPAPHYSGDLSQVYYYLRNPDGTLVNEDGTAVQPSSSGLLPGVSGGVSLTAFLADDKWPTCNGPTAASLCNTPTAVQVKTGLAQRLGFAYYVVTNGQGPCTATLPKIGLPGGALSVFPCLADGLNYAYSPYNGATNIDNSNDNSMNFFNHYLNDMAKNPATEVGKNPATEQAYVLAPNAYGSPVGWVSAFYSTDYPASLNTNNYEASTNPNTNGNALSPTGGDSCFTNYTKGTSTILKVYNGYAASDPDLTALGLPSGQSCLLTESSATVNKALSVVLAKLNITPPINTTVTPSLWMTTPPQSVVAYWNSWSDPSDGLQSITPKGSTYPAKTDLVCLVHDGGTKNAAADTTYKETNKGGYSVVSNINTGDQQENLVIANSFKGTTPSGVVSQGPNVYECPTNTVGDPYYPDPTCAELNGATLQMAWNDMGGILWDNGNYGDLNYSYSCQPPAAGTVINSAIIQ